VDLVKFMDVEKQIPGKCKIHFKLIVFFNRFDIQGMQ
jgi:hypothetical protein